MMFQILEIIVWPKNRSFPPHRLAFLPGKVNIITGASRTGKSAVIPIVDYCLGSDKCSIPVQTIRIATEWFGVLFSTSFGQMLLARKEPGALKATSEMFVLEGEKIDIPATINGKNSSVDTTKRRLDELAGLTNLDFDFDGDGSGFKRRPSFRDLGAMIFQPQNIVANPDVLFYKADTYEHREKLRSIFPYILDAVTPDLMAKQHELSLLQKSLLRKSRELNSIKTVSEKWMAEIWARAAEARELGLIDRAVPRDLAKDQLLYLLKGVVANTGNEIRVTSTTVGEAVNELVSLQKEEKELSITISGIRRRYSEMATLKQASTEYRSSLLEQKERLGVASWFKKVDHQSQDCPLCGNDFDAPRREIEELNQVLSEIENEYGRFNQVPPSFDRELERVKSDLRDMTEKLQGVRIRRQSLERSSEDAKNRQYEALRVSRFVGALDEAIKTFEKLGADAELSSEVSELQEKVRLLEKEVSQGRIGDKTKRALEIVNLNAGRLLPSLDCERPNDPVSLSKDNLTIEVHGKDRSDFLWEIGSGSNWLSYHVAITLGLQKYFIDLKKSPVPSMVIFDQPSQVYFPKKLAGKNSEVDDPKIPDEDAEAVKKVFSTLAKVVSESSGKLQIIVLDHASETIWGGIENIHLVEEWREGRKLIPKEWLE